MGRKFPPSIREWIAFACDTQLNSLPYGRFWNISELAGIDHGQSLLLKSWPHCGVQVQHFDDSDPPVHRYERPSDWYTSGHNLASNDPVFSSVTELALHDVMQTGSCEGEYYLEESPDGYAACRAAENFLPFAARFGHVAVHEGQNILAAFNREPQLRYGMMWLRVAPPLDLDTLPAALRDFIEERNRRRAAGEMDPIPF
ncbi:MAG: hypothetical protein L0241_15130 [Planctomycetia bacterium]|nr:hypothetical protein [Planctomycetia bacterium]